MPSSTPNGDIKSLIADRARAEGFEVVRFARAEAAPGAREHLATFLAQHHHGDMEWLARNAERRTDPLGLWPDAKSVVVVGANYGPAHDPLERLAQKNAGIISVYALGDDYHDVMKAKLRRLAMYVSDDLRADVKLFVDTAPVMEKPLAQRAGVGWQGKHTNLVSREFGSWLFLGSLFTTLEISPDEVEDDHCGACQRCLEICPTNAFTAPYRIDARRCISYLTIEHKGHIAQEFREAMGNRIYGCDDCLAVCPWNKFASAAREAQFHARRELESPKLADLLLLSDDAFRQLFRKSPIKRIGRDRFLRNVLIAAGNSGNVALSPSIEALLDDASPVVRAMAVWALSRLLAPVRFRELANRKASSEIDPDVRREWTLLVA
jgi:epoxyqueuosine reductase